MNFEQASKELEEIINKLENDNVNLSEGTSLFERGVELSKICLNYIKESKGKITVLKDELENLVDKQ